MGKQLAITENGKYIIGKKLFITDANLVHRKGKKAFLTVNGVHRLVYSSGVTWAKYNCNVNTVTENTGYTQVTPSEETQTFQVWALNAYYTYEFHDYSGFIGGSYNGVGNAHERIDTVEKANSVDLIGMYYKPWETEVWEIISVDEVSDLGGFTLKFTAKLVAQCEAITNTYDVYYQGSTSYGTIEIEDGELPETGTLIEGSTTNDYCVLEIDGDYYYYIKVTDSSDATWAKYSCDVDTTRTYTYEDADTNDYGSIGDSLTIEGDYCYASESYSFSVR